VNQQCINRLEGVQYVAFFYCSKLEISQNLFCEKSSFEMLINLLICQRKKFNDFKTLNQALRGCKFPSL
jgi:hypothetical protein